MVYYVAVHPSLTRAMTYYLDSVLPNRHGALFLQQGGEARQDFTAITKALTLRYIQRPITAGKFRMSVATDLVGQGRRQARDGRPDGAHGGHAAAVLHRERDSGSGEELPGHAAGGGARARGDAAPQWQGGESAVLRARPRVEAGFDWGAPTVGVSGSERCADTELRFVLHSPSRAHLPR